MRKIKVLVGNASLVFAASVLAGCLTCGPGTFEKNVDGKRQCLVAVQPGVAMCGEGTHLWEGEEGRGGERECAPDVRCGADTEEKHLNLTPAEHEEGRGVERECVPVSKDRSGI